MFIQNQIWTQTLALATLGGFQPERTLPVLPEVSRCCCNAPNEQQLSIASISACTGLAQQGVCYHRAYQRRNR